MYLVLGRGFVQGINGTTMYAEKLYSLNFTAPNKKFVLSLHYNGDNSYLFVNGTQELKFKSKNDQILKKKLCVGNLSSDWTTANSAKTGLNGKIYDFVVEYEAIDGVKQIFDTHRYLMTKHVKICKYVQYVKMLLINLLINFFNAVKVNYLECMSIINQKGMSRPKIIDIKNNEPVFYPYFIKVNKYSGSCNNINDPFAKLCVPDVSKNINIKVFNLMSRINETRQIVWHEICKCVCRLTTAICNSRQTWNEDKCRCKCKEDLINKLVCDKGYIWNPSTCACECDKLCDVGQYLDYKNCICRKSLVNKLVEDGVNIVDADSMYNETVDDCTTRAPYIVLFAVFLSISLIIGGVFIYFRWYKHNQLNFKDILNVRSSKS